MSKKSKNSFKYLTCLFVLALIAFRLALTFEPISRGDPDRYYHFAVSRVTAFDFAPETLPQVEGLGWDKFFAEKEFGFHVLTGAAFRIAQEKGVIVVCLGLAGLLFFAVFFANARRVGPILALGATVAVLLASDRFLIRMFTVRPHILATLLIVIFVWALIERKPKTVGVIAAAYALCYHAVYVPIFICGVALVSAFSIGSFRKTPLLRDAGICTAATLAGLAIGILINPYFPANILIGMQVLEIILLSAGLPISHFGGELQPWTGTGLLSVLPGFMLFLAAALFAAGSYFIPTKDGQSSDDRKQLSFEIATLLICCLIFLGLSFHNLRAVELLVPLFSLLLVRMCLLAQRPGRALSVVSVAFFLIQVPNNHKAFSNEASFSAFLTPGPVVQAADQALASVAIDSEKRRVLNCRWDVSPHLFYARSDLRFVDILDPTFLHLKDPDKYRMRQFWIDGEVPDAFGMMKEIFQADYVFCWAGDSVEEQLRHDPHFTVLFPRTLREKQTAQFSVFALSAARRDEFITNLRYGDFRHYKLATFRTAPDPDEVTMTREWAGNFSEAQIKPVYFNEIAVGLPAASQADDVVCVNVAPSQSELSRLAGAEIVGLGGGPYLELWVDGDLKYGDVGFGRPKRLVHTLVQLEKPITNGTDLRVRICSLAVKPDTGTAISFWTEASLKQICRHKMEETTDLGTSEAEQVPLRPTECFAEFARIPK